MIYADFYRQAEEMEKQIKLYDKLINSKEHYQSFGAETIERWKKEREDVRTKRSDLIKKLEREDIRIGIPNEQRTNT